MSQHKVSDYFIHTISVNPPKLNIITILQIKNIKAQRFWQPAEVHATGKMIEFTHKSIW